MLDQARFSQTNEVLFVIDETVPQLPLFLADLSENAHVIVVSAAEDGVRALAKVAKTLGCIEELHIVSHGRDGAILLGNAVLSSETLRFYSAELLTLNRALGETADILLYGCEVAKTAKGEVFVAALAELTGANIAASCTLTGAANLGGDWDLSVHVGAVTAGVGFSGAVLSSFGSVLPAADENFNGQTTHGINGTSWTVGNWTYVADDTNADPNNINLAIADNNYPLLLNNDEPGDKSFSWNYQGADVRQFGFKTADGADFKLDSFDFGVGTGSPTSVTVTGFRNGAEVVSGEVVDLTASDNSGNITYTFGGSHASGTYGVMTFAPAFQNIDEIKFSFTAAANGHIDNINVSTAITNAVPTLGGTSADVTVTEDVATAIDLSAYNVSDADGDAITLTLAVDRGTIASTDGNGTTAGVTVANSGTGSMTLQGSAANLNTYLNDISKISYTTASNDTTSAVLTVTPNDGTVNGTADTVNITISAVNDAPVLDAGQSPVLSAINEDAGDDDGSGADGDDDATNNVNNSGSSVASLVVDGSITDSDGSAVEAIAVTSVDNTNGLWQYSTDSGSTWSNFSGTTGISVDISSSARLLDSNDLVRFVPDANYVGSATITFRAWDMSTGVAGGTADATAGGGSSAFSAATDTASITVNSINDLPSITGLDATPVFTEGGAAVVLDGNVAISDVELDVLNGGNGDYSGASLTIARNGGANGVDSFGFDTSGASFTVNGGNLQSGGQTFASYTNTSGTLTVNFTSSGTTATSALADEVLQRITYQNTSNDQTSNPQLDWSFSDGTANGTGSITVTLTDVNDVPTLTATGGNPTFTEGGGAQDLYNTVTADTVETGQTLTALTLTVTNVADGASEILSFDGSDVALTNGNSVNTATNGLTVGVSVTGSTATVSFSGATLSEAQLQTLVDGLTYRNTSENPTTSGNRVVTITSVTDSGGGTNSTALNLTSTVSLTAVNNPPVIGNLDGDNTGLQPGAAANIDNGGNATVANPDSADYSGGFLTISQTGGAANGNFSVDGTAVTSDGDATIVAGETVSVSGVGIGTVDLVEDGQGGNNLRIDFGANATSARIETLIQNLSWSAAAGSGAQTFTLTLNDADGIAGGGDADTTANFTMTLGNPPVLDLDGNDSAGAGSGGFAATFTEGSGPVAIADSDLALTDSDGGATVSAITITLTNDQDGVDEGLTVSAAAQNALTGISGASDITRQDTVTITGANASLTEVQTFLQNVFYDNTSDDPDTAARTITVTVTDNDGLTSSSVTSTISVAATNDAPVFTGVDANPNFIEDGSAVVLDANATIADAELDALDSGNGSYSGATLTLSRHGAANSEDVFGNNGLLGALTEGGDLVYNSVTLGSVTTNSGGTLVLTFNGNATSSLVDSVIQNITYSNSSNTPPASIQIDYVFSDGNAGTQGSGGVGSDSNDSVTVSVTAANDAPTLGAVDGDAPSGAPNSVIIFDAGGNATVTDPDSADLDTGVLTITRSGPLSGDFALNDANATSNGDGTIGQGQTIAVGGTNIGTVITDGQGTNDLVIRFNSSDATPARVQTLIQALTYQSSETGAHGFTVNLRDGDGGFSSNATVALTVATPSSGGGGGNPVTVVTEEDNSSGTPSITTTISTGAAGSGTAAIVENTGNNGNVVTATLPASTTIFSSGPGFAQTSTEALATLVNAIDLRDSSSEAGLIGNAQSFLAGLAATTTLDVRTIVPTTTQSTLSETIVITGTSASNGASQSEAFVIDLSSLPSGASLQLDNIEFATIIGQATITGGAGQNYVTADDNRQTIILGEDDDILYGGGGNDTIGSAGGDDRIFGEEGDDVLFGGAGNDTLNGGANRDVVRYDLTSDEVSLSGTRGHVVATSSEGTDVLEGVELLLFTGANASGRDRVKVVSPDVGQFAFNEELYLETNKDVAAAVSAGQFSSGADHFAQYGRAEGREANLVFDAEFYLADNSDVAAAVAAGIFTSAAQHYALHGYKENRAADPLFDPDYYLSQNSDVAAAVEGGAFANAYQHFVLHGDKEGRAASAYFDTAAYRAEQGLGAEENALEHFLLIGVPKGLTAATIDDF